MQSRILILHTGGTIGMEESPRGLRIMKDFSKILRKWINICNIEKEYSIYIDIIEFSYLYDSADLIPKHWLNIAHMISYKNKFYDGFVILHGSDTMAWTASALSFMLCGINKPIIMTGSQIPFFAKNSDAKNNLKMSIKLAAYRKICEVCIYFGKKLWRGNRATKIATTNFQAFVSLNYPPLAIKKSNIVIYDDRLLFPQKKNLTIPSYIDSNYVAILIIYPGISSFIVKKILSKSVRGIILRSYGTGNMPKSNKLFLNEIKNAIDRGIIFINTSQCLIGSVEQDNYETGEIFSRIGVISGRDITIEAAYTKLQILLAQNLSIQEIKEKISLPQQGEMI